MAEQVVELIPGESKVVSFKAVPHEAKTYQVSVDGLTGSFLASQAPVLPMVEVVLPITWEDDGHSFATREVKTARVTIVNPRKEARDYVATLYLGTAQVATSGPQQFTLPALSYTDVRFTLTMPSQVGVYRVYLPIFSEGNLIEVFDTGEDVNVYYVAPPEAVTIDKFEVRCDFRANTLYSRITLTNHTNVTFVDQELGRYGDLVVQVVSIGVVEGGGFLQIFLPRPWDRSGIDDLPPGTHVYNSVIVGANEGRPNWFYDVGISSGAKGYCWLQFFAKDERPTPIVILASAERYLEGLFSSAWQEWGPSSFTGPYFPELPPGFAVP